MKIPLKRVAGKLRVLLVRMATGKLRIARSCGGGCYVHAIRCQRTAPYPSTSLPDYYITVDCTTGCPFFGGQLGQYIDGVCYTIQTGNGVRGNECGAATAGRPKPKIFTQAQLPPTAVIRDVFFPLVNTTCASPVCNPDGPPECCFRDILRGCGHVAQVVCELGKQYVVSGEGTSVDYYFPHRGQGNGFERFTNRWRFSVRVGCDPPSFTVLLNEATALVEDESGSRVIDNHIALTPFNTGNHHAFPWYSGIDSGQMNDCAHQIHENDGFTAYDETLDASTGCASGHYNASNHTHLVDGSGDDLHTLNATYSYTAEVPCVAGRPGGDGPPGLRSIAL